MRENYAYNERECQIYRKSMRIKKVKIKEDVGLDEEWY